MRGLTAEQAAQAAWNKIAPERERLRAEISLLEGPLPASLEHGYETRRWASESWTTHGGELTHTREYRQTVPGSKTLVIGEAYIDCSSLSCELEDVRRDALRQRREALAALLTPPDRFMEERGLTREGTVFVANHSWGGREWYPTVPKKDLPFFEEEDLNGGWYILGEEDVTYLEFVSFSSGSKLIAQRYTRDEDETTFWVIRLSVPIEDGEPYRGSYWKCFYEESGQFLPSASTDFSGVSAAFIRSSGGVRQR